MLPCVWLEGVFELKVEIELGWRGEDESAHVMKASDYRVI
jgi:hypothetical protein